MQISYVVVIIFINNILPAVHMYDVHLNFYNISKSKILALAYKKNKVMII
jgi:hypothetical protein